MLEWNLFQRNDELFRLIFFPQQRWRSLLSREATAGHAVSTPNGHQARVAPESCSRPLGGGWLEFLPAQEQRERALSTVRERQH